MFAVEAIPVNYKHWCGRLAATGAGVLGVAALRLLGATARAPHLLERAMG